MTTWVKSDEDTVKIMFTREALNIFLGMLNDSKMIVESNGMKMLVTFDLYEFEPNVGYLTCTTTVVEE